MLALNSSYTCHRQIVELVKRQRATKHRYCQEIFGRAGTKNLAGVLHLTEDSRCRCSCCPRSIKRDDICLSLGHVDREGLQALLTERSTPRKVACWAEIVLATVDLHRFRSGLLRATPGVGPCVRRIIGVSLGLRPAGKANVITIRPPKASSSRFSQNEGYRLKPVAGSGPPSARFRGAPIAQPVPDVPRAAPRPLSCP